MQIIKVKKLHPDAKMPRYAHQGDAGLELYALNSCIIKPGVVEKIATGIAIEMPHGYVGLIWDKSGLATSNNLKVMGGVIDSGYTGEYLVGMINLSTQDYAVEKGQKIAQLLIQPIIQVHPVETDEILTERGGNGFGSTGLS